MAKPLSKCASRCGDGVVAANELCDEGPNNGEGDCMQDCTFGTIY